MATKLEEARTIINAVDAQMAELFLKRMHAAEMVYAYKKELGLPILDQKREDAVIAGNAARIEDAVIREYYIDYLKNVMALSRAYQYRMQSGLNVACSGVEGTFSHIAAGRIFPESNRVSCRDDQSAYDAVVSGECDVAVLPFESSDADEAGQALDLIFSGTLFINGIYELESHQNPPDICGLNVSEATTGKHSENSCRFAVLSKVRAVSPALSGSVLIFTLKHESDSLETVIRILEKYGCPMTTLRSRPLQKHSRQEYFCMEIDGTVDTEIGSGLMDELSMVCDRFKVAGSFAPHAKIN